LRRVFSDAVNPMKIGEEAVHYWSSALSKFLLERDRLPPARILDISYLELRRDPIGTVRCVYEYFGWSFSVPAENRMRDVLAKQPRDLHGFHRYEPAQFGLRPEHEQKFFSNYCERFSLSSATARRSIKPVPASALGQSRFVQDRIG
jgi:hypothetical protein